jgi:hypothetical protein
MFPKPPDDHLVVLLTTFLTLPLHPLPHYLSLSPSSPSFLSILLTTSLPPSFPSSSSLPLSLDGRKTEVMRWMIRLQERRGNEVAD